MNNAKLPKSLRKYVRMEKGRIRRGTADIQQAKDAIAKMYERIGKTRPAVV
ncbi:MAG: hypothetical protein Q7S63_03240 [bacterium]|nr:hypothetical protein [bacterium]